MLRRYKVLMLMLAGTTACEKVQPSPASALATPPDTTVSKRTPAAPPPNATAIPDAAGGRQPNLYGKIPVLEYHLIGDSDTRWQRSYDSFRQDLQSLYDRGYRPVSVSDLVDKRLDIPAGLSPVVFTFDDASPSQFRFVEENGEVKIDPNSALGIWFEFARTHPGWSNRASFCMLSGAEAGRSFFGDKGIEGQKSEWRHRKVRILVDSGFELCNHTLWHANLSKQTDALVEEQIARLNLAIDSAVPGYKVRTLALPLGEWPKNRTLAEKGQWKEPRSGKSTSYKFDAILQVSGGLSRSPHDTLFNSLRIPRFQVFGNELSKMLDQMDRNGQRYVSAGRSSMR